MCIYTCKSYIHGSETFWTVIANSKLLHCMVLLFKLMSSVAKRNVVWWISDVLQELAVFVNRADQFYM